MLIPALNILSLLADLLAFAYLLRFLFVPELTLHKKFWLCYSSTFLLALGCQWMNWPALELLLLFILYPLCLLRLFAVPHKLNKLGILRSFMLFLLLASNVLLLWLTLLQLQNQALITILGIGLDLLTIALCRHYQHKMIQPFSISPAEIVTCLILNLLTLQIVVLLDPSAQMTEILSSGGTWLPTMLLLCILLLDGMFCFLFFQSKAKTYYKFVNQLNQQYMEHELQHFQAYKKQQETLRRYRHDMKNHLLTLELLSKKGNLEAVSRYIGNLTEQWQETAPLFHTGNDIADAIINGKYALISQQQIQLTVNGSFLTALHLPPADICTIFSNALDNAVEACTNLPADQRRISISITQNDTMFCIAFRNPLKQQPRFSPQMLPLSTKQQPEHGFGLFNIKKAVEQNQGHMQIETEAHVFTLSVLLPVQPLDTKK